MNINDSSIDHLAQECLVFCRYLSSVSPDNYILKKYYDANKINDEICRNRKTSFEKILITLARIHPLFTQVVDTYTVFLFKNALIRRKLVLLLAILESSPSSKHKLDHTEQHSRFV